MFAVRCLRSTAVVAIKALTGLEDTGKWNKHMTNTSLVRVSSNESKCLSFNLFKPLKFSGTNFTGNEAAFQRFQDYHLALLPLLCGVSATHPGLTFKNLEFWSSNSRISSSIFLILASAVTFSSCNFCRAPSSSSSCSSRSWEERQQHL